MRYLSLFVVDVRGGLLAVEYFGVSIAPVDTKGVGLDDEGDFEVVVIELPCCYEGQTVFGLNQVCLIVAGAAAPAAAAGDEGCDARGEEDGEEAH